MLSRGGLLNDTKFRPKFSAFSKTIALKNANDISGQAACISAIYQYIYTWACREVHVNHTTNMKW